MLDRRQEILARLEELAADIFPVGAVFRHREEIPEDPRPAFHMNDGDEEAADPGHARAKNALVTMTPEIWIHAPSGRAADMAKELARLRRAFLAAVLTDATLLSLVGQNGDIRFVAMVTSTSLGRAYGGAALLSLAFTYPLLAGELS